jgi:hypothetical protein
LNSARFAAIRDDEALSGEGAKERIALRQRAHTVRITKQSSASALRNQHIEHLETLSPRQRLENLITHGDKSPNYYPARFADLDAATELDSVQRAALLKRLKFAQRGRWRALAKALFTMQN